MSEELMRAILFIATVVGAVGAAYWRFSQAIAKVDKELSEYKTHVAETYSTKAGMQEQTTAIMRAIEGIAGRMDGLHERLDRLYDQGGRRGRNPP